MIRGVRVPQDVAVAGFDDIDEARFASPSLTTVSPGMEEIAELSRRLAGADRELAGLRALLSTLRAQAL